MLSHDLAALYQVQTKVLLQSVKRNKERFPKDFMFQLTWDEMKLVNTFSRSQIVTLKKGHNLKYLPYAFTEQGIAMLSSILRSQRAIQINIQIMRAFVQMRQFIKSHKELSSKLEKLEQKYSQHDEEIQIIFDIIKKMMAPEIRPRHKIGFAIEKK